MSGQRLYSYLSHARDGGKSLRDGWYARHGEEKLRCDFHLWLVGPLETLNADDVLWAMVAAMSDRRATHVCIHAKRESDLSAIGLVTPILDYFASLYGFNPIEITCEVDENEENVTLLRVSLFSRLEAYRLAQYPVPQYLQ